MSDYKKRILIVEDNQVAARVGIAFLQALGCQVEHVADGETAIKQVMNTHYDGIYMDIGLPAISGIETCIAIREYEAKNPELNPVPIIAVTANKDLEKVAEYLESGMQDVIFKPLTQEKALQFLSHCDGFRVPMGQGKRKG